MTELCGQALRLFHESRYKERAGRKNPQQSPSWGEWVLLFLRGLGGGGGG